MENGTINAQIAITIQMNELHIFYWNAHGKKIKATRSTLLQLLRSKTENHLELTKTILNLDFKSQDTTTQKLYALVHKMYKIREKAFRKPKVKTKPPIVSLYNLTFMLAFLPNFYQITN